MDRDRRREAHRRRDTGYGGSVGDGGSGVVFDPVPMEFSTTPPERRRPEQPEQQLQDEITPYRGKLMSRLLA